MRNRDIRDPLNEREATYVLETQAAYYTNFVRIYIPKGTVFKLLDGLERRKPEDYLLSAEKYRAETDVERSIRRTRKAIKDYALCNQFELFATFTFGKNRQDTEHVKKRMVNWFKNEAKRKGRFQYLVVPELHKDKQSLHFHALIRGYKGEVRQSLKDDKKPRIQHGRPVFTLPSYTHGFTNVKQIDQNRESATTVGLYLQKYITKDMPIFFGKNRYWASHGLKKPVIQDNPEPFYLAVKPDREYENDYGKIIEIDKGTSPLVDMFIEVNQP